MYNCMSGRLCYSVLFQIANAELEALRAENRNLRLGPLGGSPGGSTCVDLDASEAQREIVELRDSHGGAVTTLEVNYRLLMIE